jgi:hypothetical protein
MRSYAFDRHHINHPWADAPPWALELRVMLGLILEGEEIIMSQETDALDQAETAAKNNADAEDSVIGILNTVVSQLNAIKTAGGDPAVVARVSALATALQARTSVLAAAAVAGTPAA